MAHWLVSAAARGGLGDVSTVDVADDTEIGEAWLRVCGELGINPQRLAKAVAQATRMSLADLSSTEPEARTLLPERLARHLLVMPLRATYRELMVATSQPLDVDAEKEIGFVSGRRPIFEVATPHEIEDAIDVAFSSSSPRSPMGDTELDEAHAKVQPAPEAMATAPDDARDEGVIRLNRLVIYEAAREKAEEIHLTPGKSVGRVLFKVDGKLKTFLSLPLDTLAMIVARLRGMAELTNTTGLAVGGFEVRIDRQPYQLTVQTVPDYDHQLILGLSTDLSVPMNPLAPTAGSQVSHGDGSSLHILVVDDDEGQRLLIRSVLEKSGFRVSEADDGTTAFPILEGEDEIDAVLLDLMMERMDGMETLEKIRQTRSLAVLPVVILTASEDSKNELKLLRAGADDYLRKPVDPRILVQRINAVIRRVRALMA